MKLFKGRINRKNYLIGLIMFGILEFIATIPTWVITYSQRLNEFRTLSETEVSKLVVLQFSLFSITGIIFYILITVVIFLSLNIYIRRLHDIGKSGLLAVIVVLGFLGERIFSEWILYSNFQLNFSNAWILHIPNLMSLIVGIFVVYLLIKKGQDMPNKYGDVPVDKTSFKNILIAK